MKTVRILLNILSWVGVVIGFIAMLGGLQQNDPYALWGGALFFFQGLFALIYIWDNEYRL